LFTNGFAVGNGCLRLAERKSVCFSSYRQPNNADIAWVQERTTNPKPAE